MTLTRQLRHKARTSQMPPGERAHRAERPASEPRGRHVARCAHMLRCSPHGDHHAPGCPLYSS